MATVLMRGSKGLAVRELQDLLNKAGASPRLNTDGDFGAKTDAALRAFQARVGLVPDGRYGPQSRTALRQATTPAKTPARAEPDKSAMGQPAPKAAVVVAGAAPPPNVSTLQLLDTARPIHTLWWHCAATPEGKDFTVEDIRQWHKARGWSDIGYHYIIYPDGRIMLGRPVGQVGAHVQDHNTGSIGGCYIGGVSSDGKNAKDTRTPAQISSMLWLTQQLVARHPIKRVRGHNEVTAKACPSFDVQQDPLGKLAA
ncbi:N-acetylmuramoyl-L-alanine amidase [Pelagibacterium limicola]|uniref:N-acetylmuramoyl-L-alanine amidase n=1 Tax=Pelagibacterium limicola TaxID=2791022 RepID=UPI0018B00F26|nr:N-acetylmuramoyl-L-alanine amidase [Pelagibacterium limicola]